MKLIRILQWLFIKNNRINTNASKIEKTRNRKMF